MIRPAFARAKLLLPLLAVLLLAGCLNDKVDKAVERNAPVAQSGVRHAESPATEIKYDPLQVTDQVWTGGQAIRMRRGLPLPATVEGSRAVTLISGEGMSLSDIASFINNATGISVRLTDGAERLGNAGGSGGPLVNNSGGRSSSGSSSANSSSSGSNALNDNIRPMTLAYEGPLSGLLDQVASHYGVNWRFDGKGINISRFETRTFVVEAMPGTAAITDGLQAESSGGSSGGSGTSGATSSSTNSLDQRSELKAELDYWSELEESVTTILGGVGAVRTSPTSGSLTVITTPEIMRTVAQYLAEENRRNTRQVAITVELFTLKMEEGESYNTSFTALFNDIDIGRFGLTSAALPTVDGTTGSELAATVISPTSKWAGSEALVQALSTLGNVSRVARIPVTTLNNRPASRRIGRDQAYLASVSVSQSGDSNFQQASLTPGVVREGFSLQVTPRILGDGRILVQYSLSVIDIEDIVDFPVGDNRIQLPETTSRVFVQQAMLNNGDSLVLSGFDQDLQTNDRRGFGNPYNWLMGGSATSSTSREMFFLTMTPREIDVPRKITQW